MKLNVFQKTLLCGLLVLGFAACNKGTSNTTGWKYNDAEYGGFQVVDDYDDVGNFYMTEEDGYEKTANKMTIVNIIKNLNPETILRSEILSQVIVSALVDASNGEVKQHHRSSETAARSLS